MERIIMQRGYGKTTRLIKMSASDGSVIVCANNAIANSLMWKAKDLGLDIPRPISFEYFLSAKYYHSGASTKSLLIDDVDFLLQKVSMVPIKAITLSPYDSI